MLKNNLAAIDLGTNSCRLTIADPDGHFLYRDSIPTKLGEGLHENGAFTPQALQRGYDAFAEYADMIRYYRVGRYRAVATASCRMASNGEEFIRNVHEKTGISLEIIDGYEEARLNLKGAVQNADPTKEYVIVYDLGGGSTEISLARRCASPEIIHTISIPWGARNSAEAFELQNFSDSHAFQLKAEIQKYVDAFVEDSGLAEKRAQTSLVATSSMPLRLVSMIRSCGVYDREKCDGLSVSCRELDEAIEKTQKMSLAEREKSPYIGKNRAPIFISAGIIFKTIYDGLKLDSLTASLKGAQDAIIEELKSNA